MKALSALENAIQATAQAYQDLNDEGPFSGPNALDKAEATACVATAHMSLEKAQRLLAGENPA